MYILLYMDIYMAVGHAVGTPHIAHIQYAITVRRMLMTHVLRSDVHSTLPLEGSYST